MIMKSSIKNWLFSAPQKNKDKAAINSKHKKAQEDKPKLSIAEVDAEAAMLENDRIIDGEQIELKPLMDGRRQPRNSHSHSGIPSSSYDRIKAQKIKEGLKHKPMNERAARNVDDVTQLEYDRRWSLYQYWISQYLHQCKQKIAEIYALACWEYQAAQNELDYAVLYDAHVVGATTTGAAKYHDILQKRDQR